MEEADWAILPASTVRFREAVTQWERIRQKYINWISGKDFTGHKSDILKKTSNLHPFDYDKNCESVS